MKRGTDISTILSPLRECRSQAYLCDLLQVADVLEWILTQLGTSEVWQTSFSISEEFLRRLHFIAEKGQMTNIHLILDRKATNMTLRLWPFIRQTIADTTLCDNHSKILLIKSQTGEKVSVITSQNLTRGNRNESAFITTEESVFDRLLSDMQSLKSKGIPFSEIMDDKINEYELHQAAD